MDMKGQELGPYEPVSDELILAAIDRAIRQGPNSIWVVHVAEHLGFRHQGQTTRKVRHQLERLRVQDGTVERLDRMAPDYWQLTPDGRRVLELARAEGRPFAPERKAR